MKGDSLEGAKATRSKDRKIRSWVWKVRSISKPSLDVTNVRIFNFVDLT